MEREEEERRVVGEEGEGVFGEIKVFIAALACAVF
jgi:hypothetical protein